MANIRLRDLNPAKFLNDLEVDNAVRINTTLSEGAQLKVEADSGNAYAALFKKGTAGYWFADGAMYFNSVNGMYMVNQSSYLRLGANNAEIMRMQSGKVGIGTGGVVPTEILTLNSSSNTRLVVQEAGADKGSIGAGGSGLYIRNLAGSILFRNIADATTMKIFDNGHITFGSNNNVGSQNHSFNPGASYPQDRCSIALHAPAMAGGKKNWCMRTLPLSGSTSYSYLQFRPLNDDGTDHGDGTFFFNHLFSDIVFKSSSGYHCQLDVESVSGEASVRLRGKTAGGGADWNLHADDQVNLFRIWRNGENSSPNLSLRSTGVSGPGGIGIGTNTLDGGGVTWKTKARILKIVGDSDSGSHSVGDEQAGAGIVLYDTDEGNTTRSWAIYQEGLLYNSKLAFQFGWMPTSATKMNYYGTWAYKGGVQQTAWMHWGTTAGNSTTTNYLHIKTNLKRSDNDMFRFHFEGYAYGNRNIIDSICVGYMYSGHPNSSNPITTRVMNNAGTDGIHIATGLFNNGMYTTSVSDGEYLVVVFKMPPGSRYYSGFIGTAVMAAMAGKGYEVVHKDTADVTHTNEVW
jgi:hypothetical protein